MSVELSGRARRIRSCIHEYIETRFREKTEKLDPSSDEYEKRLSEYEPYTWLASAAERSGQIQVVTHPLKATYPDAKLSESSSLFAPPSQVAVSAYFSSRDLGTSFQYDVSGNAAALDVYGLLRQEFEDTTVLALCVAMDNDTLSALHDDPAIASSWMNAFRAVTDARTPRLASSTGAKQILWLCGDDPVNDEEYCVLSPMYPSHLSTRIFQAIQEHRFGDESKAARADRRAGKPSSLESIDYLGLAKTTIGGSNPQNISQLNSGRRGVNFLLSNLPPVWRGAGMRPLWGTDSLFRRLETQQETRHLVRAFSRFLESDPPATVETRQRVQRFLDDVIDSVVAFAAQYQQLPAGWTADVRCLLPVDQKVWLDPLRAVEDDAFFARAMATATEEAIGRQFAAWLNTHLREKLPVGDVENRQWKREFSLDDDWRSQVESLRKNRVAAGSEGSAS